MFQNRSLSLSLPPSYTLLEVNFTNNFHTQITLLTRKFHIYTAQYIIQREYSTHKSKKVQKKCEIEKYTILYVTSHTYCILYIKLYTVYKVCLQEILQVGMIDSTHSSSEFNFNYYCNSSVTIQHCTCIIYNAADNKGHITITLTEFIIFFMFAKLLFSLN